MNTFFYIYIEIPNELKFRIGPYVSLNHALSIVPFLKLLIKQKINFSAINVTYIYSIQEFTEDDIYIETKIIGKITESFYD